MISKPSTAQLIEAVNAELASKVSPELDAGTTRVVLDMAMAVLQGAATRSANELAWMREEEQAVADVAERLVAELPSATGLAEAYRAYTDNRSDSLYLADAMADYERVSEVLSCAAEAVYAEGDPGRIAAVQELFDQRLANENAVIGAFQAVGRT
jgi:hypothetical protein